MKAVVKKKNKFKKNISLEKIHGSGCGVTLHCCLAWLLGDQNAQLTAGHFHNS